LHPPSLGDAQGLRGIFTVIDRKLFFASVRLQFGKLRQTQVNGFGVILDEWEECGQTDLRFLAYCLATAWHETGQTMQPIREYGKDSVLKRKKYWPWVGRGFVQITWKANYQKYGIADHPEKAMEPKLAAHILIDGMVRGIFTGKKLGDYFTKKSADPVCARRIVNGQDRAGQISVYHAHFLSALFAAHQNLDVKKLR
jgi:putative chitinase